MATPDLRTPGVYIEEKNAFPPSAVAVETAVPVFIGYTEKAETLKGVDLNYKPQRISSLSEYVENFGEGFNPVFSITPVQDTPPAPVVLADGDPRGPSSPPDVFSYLDKKGKKFSFDVKFKDHNVLYMYNAIRLFFLNGGSNCFIMSVGTYEGKDSVEIKKDDFNQKNKTVWDILKIEIDPTIVVMPDVIALGEKAYIDFYQQALLHCDNVKSRVSIFDVCQSDFQHFEPDDVNRFRDHIGTSALKYGAAYYPWLHTTLYSDSDIDFVNIDSYDTLIASFPDVAPVDGDSADLAKSKKSILDKLKAFKASGGTPTDKTMIHQSLLVASPTYKGLMGTILGLMNIIPPSGAMAGIYALTDNDRGVWKAPANVSVSSVTAPTINISHEQQLNLNVDALTGKSINIIRPFPSIGTLVWGARTLDGNSQDWRYINVRRTLIMIEQSLKLATRAFVFEPNNNNTWVVITSMFNNFLKSLWMQGALAGAAPEQAFEVQLGLGTTMTPTDILDGIMRISVKLAIVRPAEFIVITFQQQQQQS